MARCVSKTFAFLAARVTSRRDVVWTEAQLECHGCQKKSGVAYHDCLRACGWLGSRLLR